MDDKKPQGVHTLTVEMVDGGWRIRRRGPAGDQHLSKQIYASDVEAAVAAHRRAQWALETHRVVLNDATFLGVEAFYQMEGYAQANGYGRWSEPWNQWIQQGYLAAQADAAGVRLFGWPEAGR